MTALEKIRIDAVKSMNLVIPTNLKKQLLLVSDTLSGNRYRACYMTANAQKIIIVKIEDCSKPKEPVRIIPVGFNLSAA